MRLRFPILIAVVLLGSASLASAQLTTESDVRQKLESNGYSKIHEVKFGSDGITAKAVKDGKEWSLVLDSSGKIMQLTSGSTSR